MELQSRRIRRRIERDDDLDMSDPPPMESNEVDSAASGANPVGPDSTDEQRLGNLLGHFLSFFCCWFCFFD